MKLLEVCVDSLASARAAKQGGADRLEFCSALAVGGLTPYADLLRQIKAELDLPVRCLMRPRAGDFLYTRDEIELLCRQIGTLRSAGADGFVIGALTPEGALDLPAMRTLLDACGGAPVTLHRCIDVSRDLCATYRAAAALGIDTVLTSGGAGSCRKGISQLAALLRLRDELDGPEVLIGAGVNAAVIDELRAAISGKLSAFTGNSGVGKSSILNALCPELKLPVGEVSEKLGRGRHTTRHIELYCLGNGTFVADTPGFSSFDTERMDLVLKDQLQYAFSDFAPYLGKCQFPDCAHLKEPGCAVRAALERGEIEPTRYESYKRLYEMAKEIKPWELK